MSALSFAFPHPGVDCRSHSASSSTSRRAQAIAHVVAAFFGETGEVWAVSVAALGVLAPFQPTRKMVFTVLGAVAELERSLITERVRAGLRNAKAKGKCLGRQHVVVDAAKISALRDSGASWPQIARELGVSIGTAHKAAHSLSKNLPD